MMNYTVTKLENGQLMLAHEGDCIAFSDPNHGPNDPADKRDFAIMCLALNFFECIRTIKANS